MCKKYPPTPARLTRINKWNFIEPDQSAVKVTKNEIQSLPLLVGSGQQSVCLPWAQRRKSCWGPSLPVVTPFELLHHLAEDGLANATSGFSVRCPTNTKVITALRVDVGRLPSWTEPCSMYLDVLHHHV